MRTNRRSEGADDDDPAVDRGRARSHHSVPRPIEPLLPREFTAPVDYRWPDYVPTPDGREWWIPDNPDF